MPVFCSADLTLRLVYAEVVLAALCDKLQQLVVNPHGGWLLQSVFRSLPLPVTNTQTTQIIVRMADLHMASALEQPSTWGVISSVLPLLVSLQQPPLLVHCEQSVHSAADSDIGQSCKLLHVRQAAYLSFMY